MSSQPKYYGNLIKEIEQSPDVLAKVLTKYTKDGQYKFKKRLIRTLKQAENVYLLACGTSYHSALSAKRFFYNLKAHYKVRVGSEWALNPYAHHGKTVYIMISQSGETADLIRCLPHLRDDGTLVVVTNSPKSTLAQRADYVLNVFAGVEKAIASTKAYVAQVAVLALLAGAIKEDYTVIDELTGIIDKQRQIIANREQYYETAKHFLGEEDAYILGWGSDYPIALECSLKLKEITYIHSEAFYGGEFKHGPISLIQANVPVILILSEKHVAPFVRQMEKDIKGFGGNVFVIASESLKEEGDSLTVPDTDEDYALFLKVMVVQYIAYFLAVQKHMDVDKPRHLTKAVTQ